MNNTQYRQVFTRLEELPAGTDSFARCRFENCRLPGAVLNGLTFEDCLFCGCDLSLAQVKGTAFKNVVFEECKLQGLPLYTCARWLLAVQFKKCVLRFASFAGLPLKKTVFEECDLREASFAQTLLQEASFVRCDLTRRPFCVPTWSVPILPPLLAWRWTRKQTICAGRALAFIPCRAYLPSTGS